MSYVLVGNYGVGNLGDEALRISLEHLVPEAHFRVISANPGPDELPRLPCGIRSFLLTPWWKTVGALVRSDGLVFGGGALFTDVESSRACILLAIHAFIALLLRRPIFLAFQGIGPFRRRWTEAIVRSVVRWARFVSVRDAASRARVESWGLSKNVVQTFDPVFSLFTEHNADVRTQNVIVIIPRHNSPLPFFGWVAEHLGSDARGVRVLLLEPDHPGEQAIALSLPTLLPCRTTVIPIRTVDDLIRWTAGVRLVLTQRYHGALAGLAAAQETKVFPQLDDDKLAALGGFLEDSLASRRIIQDLLLRGTQELRTAMGL